MWIEDITIIICQLGEIICQMFRNFDMTFNFAYTIGDRISASAFDVDPM